MTTHESRVPNVAQRTQHKKVPDCERVEKFSTDRDPPRVSQGEFSNRNFLCTTREFERLKLRYRQHKVGLLGADNHDKRLTRRTWPAVEL